MVTAAGESALLTAPLPFDTPYLRALAYGLAADRELWAKIGEHLLPQSIPDRAASFAVYASKEIATATGRGPGSHLAVIAQMRSICERGQASIDDVWAVAEALDQGKAADVPSDTLAAQVGEVLRERARLLALDKALQGADAAQVGAELIRVPTIGVTNDDLGLTADADAFDTLEANDGPKLPTPIIPLTAALGGGLALGDIGAVCGHSGDGKSIYLAHQFAVARCCGLNVLALTGELAAQRWFYRYAACLTEVPEREIRDGSGRARAQQIMRGMQGLGYGAIRDFPADVFTVPELEHVLDKIERERKLKIHVLVIDYADRMTAPGGPGQGKGDYAVAKLVYEGLRNLGKRRGMWVWTASQPQRSVGLGPEGIIDRNGWADSQWKMRVLDVAVSINNRDDGRSKVYFVCKNRLDESGHKIGPYPHDFGRGRMVATSPMVAALANGGLESWPEEWQADWVARQISGQGAYSGQASL